MSGDRGDHLGLAVAADPTDGPACGVGGGGGRGDYEVLVGADGDVGTDTVGDVDRRFCGVQS